MSVAPVLEYWSLLFEAIEGVEFEDGSIKLGLRHRAPVPDRRASPIFGSAPRETARIITMVWGDRYVADMLAVTIPALLAPGNLPAFVEFFDCQFVIVTETRLFQQLANAPVILQLLQYCDLRLVPIDDLLSPWYGITLTYALVRGFADLGDAITDTHLVFLNADFIVADGSYRRLAEVIRRGERLVVSPSYCMVQEQAIGHLRAHYDEQSCALTISPRAMAAMIIENRHNTIRAKTINQRLFRIHRYDQFYWHVDDRTLLARQMPIAVVYMRPERAIKEMPTFWDYGVVSEYCPNIVPCVLGDSDDFLMGELRTAGTFRELLRLGWPSVDEIAADLSSFTTKDHRVYGRFTLVLHAEDLPANLEAEKEQLAAFVDSIYSRMSPPISYRDHPFWADAFPRFSQMVRENGEKLRAALRTRHALHKTPDGRKRRDKMKRLREELTELRGRRLALLAARQEREEDIGRKLELLEESYQRERQIILQERDELRQKDEADLQTLDRHYLTLEQKQAVLTAEVQKILEGPSDPQLGIEAVSFDESDTESDDLPRPASSAELPHALDDLLPPALTEVRQPRGLERTSRQPYRRRTDKASGQAIVARAIRLLSPLYRRIFGQLPRTRRCHPYHAMLEPAFRAIMSIEDRVSNVLVITSGGALGSTLIKPLAARTTSITPSMAFMGIYDEILIGRDNFDLCVCDLSFADFRRLRALLDFLRPRMASGGKIIVFHQTMAGEHLDTWTYDFATDSFPLFGRSRVFFTGSLPSKLATRWFSRVLFRRNIFRVGGLAAIILTLAASAPFALLGIRLEERRDSQKLPRHCTSMTIEIDLP